MQNDLRLWMQAVAAYVKLQNILESRDTLTSGRQDGADEDDRVAMRVHEMTPDKKTYVANCKDAFDEDGECMVPELGFRDVSMLGYADETARRMSRKDFMRLATLPPELSQQIKGHRVEFLSFDEGHLSILMLYDVDTDTHYFFA